MYAQFSFISNFFPLSSAGTEALVVTTSDLLLWSFQIANGMQYLASHKVVHGDLAARNIYLCEDRSCEDNILKIGDLGLAQSLFKTDAYLKKKQVRTQSNDMIFSK